MKALLLIACSNRKNNSSSMLPAIELYDGGTFRVIRKLQREEIFPQNIDIKIISARYGFIDAQEKIGFYEQKMTPTRAFELQNQIQTKLLSCLDYNDYSRIYVDLGKEYLPIVKEIINNQKCEVLIAKGRIGERLKFVKNWIIRIKNLETQYVPISIAHI